MWIAGVFGSCKTACTSSFLQDLRIQRQQLVGELQLRQQQLQELAGRQQQMELEGMEMEQQRRQLLHELQLLRRARDRQRQIQQLLEVQQAQPVGGQQWGVAGQQDTRSTPVESRQNTENAHHRAGADNDLAALGGYLVEYEAEGASLQRCRQLEEMLEAFLGEQEAAGRSAVTHAAAAAGTSSGAAAAAGREQGIQTVGVVHVAGSSRALSSTPITAAEAALQRLPEVDGTNTGIGRSNADTGILAPHPSEQQHASSQQQYMAVAPDHVNVERGVQLQQQQLRNRGVRLRWSPRH